MKLLNIICCILLSSPLTHTLEIAIINPQQSEAIKELIIQAAYEVFHLDESMEQFRKEMADTHQFYDIENVEKVYLNNGGIFLVLLDGDTIIGSGAIRKLDDETAELKRMWFKKEYRGRGWGSKLAQQLIAFAKEQGYKKICLDVWKPEYQEAAVNLYKKLGFYEVPAYNQSPATLFMEMVL